MFYAVTLKHIKKIAAAALILAAAGFIAFLCLNILYPLKHIDIIRHTCAKYGLDPAFICSLIYSESRFAPYAESKKGASGLMQVTKPTAEWIAGQIGMEGFDYADIFEPGVNINIGCAYVRRLLDQYAGDPELALAAYNAGEGNVAKWLTNPQYSRDGVRLDYIPFGETRGYIKKVMENINVYRMILKFI